MGASRVRVPVVIAARCALRKVGFADESLKAGRVCLLNSF